MMLSGLFLSFFLFVLNVVYYLPYKSFLFENTKKDIVRVLKILFCCCFLSINFTFVVGVVNAFCNSGPSVVAQLLGIWLCE